MPTIPKNAIMGTSGPADMGTSWLGSIFSNPFSSSGRDINLPPDSPTQMDPRLEPFQPGAVAGSFNRALQGLKTLRDPTKTLGDLGK